MAASRGFLVGIRKFGGGFLKMVGLVTIGDKVSKTVSGFSDMMTIAVIAGVALLILGGRR